MSSSQYRVQYYDHYEVEFTSTVPSLGDEFDRNIIKYLYNKENTDNTVLKNEESPFISVFNGAINKETNYEGYAITTAVIGDNNNQNLVVGLVVELHSNKSNGTPYFFLANNTKLSFWKTDIENYDGDFAITSTDFVVQNVLGIRRIPGSTLCEVTIPFKSAFLVGKYENCVANQDKILFKQSSTTATGYFSAVYKWTIVGESIPTVSVSKGRRKFK